MGKLTISMAMFNSYVSLPEGMTFGPLKLWPISRTHASHDDLWSGEHRAAVLHSVQPLGRAAWHADVATQKVIATGRRGHFISLSAQFPPIVSGARWEQPRENMFFEVKIGMGLMVS